MQHILCAAPLCNSLAKLPERCQHAGATDSFRNGCPAASPCGNGAPVSPGFSAGLRLSARRRLAVLYACQSDGYYVPQPGDRRIILPENTTSCTRRTPGNPAHGRGLTPCLRVAGAVPHCTRTVANPLLRRRPRPRYYPRRAPCFTGCRDTGRRAAVRLRNRLAQCDTHVPRSHRTTQKAVA